jgi:phosphoserine phosphatase
MEDFFTKIPPTMSDKPRHYVFDFDKTLIDPDSTLGFFLFKQKPLKQWMIILHYGLMALMRRLGFVSKRQVKLLLFNVWFSLLSEIELSVRGNQYSKTLRLNKLGTALQKGFIGNNARIWVVTASLSVWVDPLFDGLNVEVIGSKLVKNERGKWCFKFHCMGEYKARALKERGIIQIDRVYTDGWDDASLVQMSDEWHGVCKGQVVEVGRGLITFESWAK